MFRRLLVWGVLALGVLSLQHCGWNWSETYRIDKDHPFDLYVLHELLKARPEGLQVLEDSLVQLRDTVAEHQNYIFVGNYAYYDEQAITDLLDFVERGNTAFVAAYQLPEELASILFGEECLYEYTDYYDPNDPYNSYGYGGASFVDADTVQLGIQSDTGAFELVNIRYFKPENRMTYYIPETYLCDPEFDNEAIGTLDEVYTNFVRLNFGEGNFYFNSHPIFFTNYYLVDSLQDGLAYAEEALAVLGEGPVFWDEGSRVPPSVARQRTQRNSQQQGRGYSGGRNLLTGNEALSYIQEQGPLALSWYALVFTALLFVVFRGKRRQRIIPVINRRENSSKRFIDTMSRLVFQKGNHAVLATQELASLRFHLQDRFGVKWKEGEAPPENLAELIGGPEAVIRQALIEIRIVQKKKELEESELLRFYRAIEPLYRL